MSWGRGGTANRGSLVAATWLIGLGIVFLVQRAADLSWRQAWPMFVILAGVAALVTKAFGWRPGVAGIWELTLPVITIVVGSLLLASTTGSLGSDPGRLIADLWPWLLVGLGVWYLIGAVIPGGGPLQETLAIALDSASEAAVRIKFGAGELTVARGADGNLVDGRYEGGVRSLSHGPGRVELEQDITYGVPWVDRRSRWEVGVNGDVPLDLRFDIGATKTVIDARDLHLRSLELHTGASDTRVLLPRAAGVTTVRAEAGAASVVFEVPAGVAARIRSRMALGSSQIDQARFPAVGGGYESPDYATAPNRVDIDVQGGVGSVKVVGA
jgi:hypothetical protein